MIAIRAHFDGKHIQLPPELITRPPGEVLVIFDDRPHDQPHPHALQSDEARRHHSKLWSSFGDDYDPM